EHTPVGALHVPGAPRQKAGGMSHALNVALAHPPSARHFVPTMQRLAEEVHATSKQSGSAQSAFPSPSSSTPLVQSISPPAATQAWSDRQTPLGQGAPASAPMHADPFSASGTCCGCPRMKRTELGMLS